jgi:hypothetical protein
LFGGSNNAKVDKDAITGHDLLSLLIKSNLATGIPENMRMTDSEIVSRALFNI